ncbi:hypothetical protein FHG87_011211 [Trinorchestia longiramus]|nr:hypothetical protein FHG87_011211 [Trinorchestia longiramus]
MPESLFHSYCSNGNNGCNGSNVGNGSKGGNGNNSGNGSNGGNDSSGSNGGNGDNGSNGSNGGNYSSGSNGNSHILVYFSRTFISDAARDAVGGRNTGGYGPMDSWAEVQFTRHFKDDVELAFSDAFMCPEFKLIL